MEISLVCIKFVLQPMEIAIDGNCDGRKQIKELSFSTVDSFIYTQSLARGHIFSFSSHCCCPHLCYSVARAEIRTQTYLPNHFTNGLNCFHLIRSSVRSFVHLVEDEISQCSTKNCTCDDIVDVSTKLWWKNISTSEFFFFLCAMFLLQIVSWYKE